MVFEWIWNWFRSFLGIDLIQKAMDAGTPIPAQAYLQLIFSPVTLLFWVLFAYRGFYLLVGLFARTRKYKPAPKDKRYAFLIPARNEESVIENLLQSIREQDYPADLIDVYVLADNCAESDKTAEIARKNGCIVWERKNPSLQRKGFALQEFFAQSGFNPSDYYAVVFFDADNVLAPDFLSKMNDAMQEGHYTACAGYRNIKNLNENWVSAICGINMHRNIVSISRPRSVLHCKAQLLNGTGFALSTSYLEKHGWDCLSLCEDGELSARITLENEPMGFCEEAVYYDEQPISFPLSMRQRLRWTKGGHINWIFSGTRLLLSFFRRPTWQKYDAFWDHFPYALLSFLWSFAYQATSLILFLVQGNNGYDWGTFWGFVLSFYVGGYLTAFFTGLVIEIREWRRIHFNLAEAILYLFVWPFYDLLGVPVNVAALFVRPIWKPVPHHVIASGAKLAEEEQKKAKKKRQG